jgi:hypothetical protein
MDSHSLLAENDGDLHLDEDRSLLARGCALLRSVRTSLRVNLSFIQLSLN